MKIVVVVAHPDLQKKSFNHAITERVTAGLKSRGHEVLLHDLYAEDFQPVMAGFEIQKDAEIDPSVRQMGDELSESGGIVIVHPNWWGQPPAILKGWLDRVVRQGVGYNAGPSGIEGLFTEKKAAVFTTSNTDDETELKLFGDPLDNLWKKSIFGFCGIKQTVRRNFGSVIMSTPEQRGLWLKNVEEIIADLF